MEPDDLSVLAQRAASEGPRWTRAVEDQSAPIPREIASKLGRISLLARCGLAWDKARLGAPGWEGEKSGLFEHPANAQPY